MAEWVVLETVASIIRDWDYDKFREEESNLTVPSINPVVKRSQATVLCLFCMGSNSESFKFCQHCGKEAEASIQVSDIKAQRIFGSERMFINYVH